MKTTYFFSLMISLLFSQLAFSQWSDDSATNTTVKDDPTSDEVTPLSVTTDDGYTYVSWFESNGSQYVLKMQLIDPSGHFVWDPAGLLISDKPQNSALFVYDLKADHDGNAIVAFQDERLGFLSTVAYKVDRSGNFVWGNDGILLHDKRTHFELAPAIGILSNNDVIIAWNANSGDKKWIPYRKINADGTLSGGIEHIRNNTLNFSRPQFLSLDDSTCILTFIKETGSFPALTSLIYARKLDADAQSVWASDTKVSNSSISFVAYPKLETDGNNGMYVGYTTGDPANSFLNDAYLQHVDMDGTVAFSKNGIEVSNYANHNRECAGIAFVPDQNDIWVLLKVLNNSQGKAGIYVQEVNAEGNKQLGSKGQQLNRQSSIDYDEPYGIKNTGNGLILVYTEGGYGTQKLKAMKIDYQAELNWTTTMSSVLSNKYDLTLGNYSNHQVVAVWFDDRNGGGVYAQNINSDGVLGISDKLATGITSNNFVNVYPSLASDHLIITMQHQPTAYFTLVGLDGKEVMHSPLADDVNKVSLPSLRPGLYLYKIFDGEKYSDGKIMIVQK